MGVPKPLYIVNRAFCSWSAEHKQCVVRFVKEKLVFFLVFSSQLRSVRAEAQHFIGKLNVLIRSEEQAISLYFVPKHKDLLSAVLGLPPRRAKLSLFGYLEKNTLQLFIRCLHQRLDSTNYLLSYFCIYHLLPQKNNA